MAKSGEKDLIYKTLIGLKADLSTPALRPEILSKEESESDGADEGSDEESSEESEDESKFVNSSRPKNETVEDKKVKIALV